MLDIWFGLDASGFEKASGSTVWALEANMKTDEHAANFHPYFGPVLMVTYACLSNTLLLTGKWLPIAN